MYNVQCTYYVPHTHTPNYGSLYKLPKHSITLYTSITSIKLENYICSTFSVEGFCHWLIDLATVWIIYSHQFKPDFLYLHK